jgi:ABC-type antimicrobial peptide transport system permease subunit
MSARRKLNVAFVNGSLVVAAAVGLLAGSWPVFWIALVMLLVANIYRGDIRPPRPRI